MNDTAKFHIEAVSWASHQQALQAIRTTVFIEEQKVPVELEWDEHDRSAYHVVAVTNNGDYVGTARLLENGHIGRMAVLKTHREQGIASAMLHCLLVEAKTRGLEQVFLYAQISAVGFYQKQGFSAYGEQFIDAGIPHIPMKHALSEVS